MDAHNPGEDAGSARRSTNILLAETDGDFSIN